MHHDATDEELVEEYRQGDAGAFEELVRRHQRALVNYFYRQCWDAHLAEDYAQEVFVRLFKHLPAFDPRAKFTTYMYRIARNLWIDRLRSLRVRGTHASLENPVRPGEESTAGAALPAPDPAPVDDAARHEETARLRRALASLPDELRDVVILAEFQGMKYEEIGAVLDIPVGTVKSRMHTAIARLREMLVAKEPP